MAANNEAPKNNKPGEPDKWVYDLDGYYRNSFEYYRFDDDEIRSEEEMYRELKAKLKRPPGEFKAIGIVFQFMGPHLRSRLMQVHIKLYDDSKLPGLFNIVKIQTSDNCFRVGIVDKIVDFDRVDVTLLIRSAKNVKRGLKVYDTGLIFDGYQLAKVVVQRFLQKTKLTIRQWWTRRWRKKPNKE